MPKLVRVSAATPLSRRVRAVEGKRAQAAARLKAIEEQAAALRARRDLEEQLMRVTGAVDQLRTLLKQSPAPAPSDDRLRILRVAEIIAEARMKSASADLFLSLESEVVAKNVSALGGCRPSPSGQQDRRQRLGKDQHLFQADGRPETASTDRAGDRDDAHGPWQRLW